MTEEFEDEELDPRDIDEEICIEWNNWLSDLSDIPDWAK